jgi:DNA segregation ATPase FtsK/SpoIIIE, S-DNA-T family
MKNNNQIEKLDFTVNFGKDELGNDIIIDISKLSNTLIGGSRESGKTNLLHKIITTTSSKLSAEYLKFILVDPKKVELGIYNCIPHLLTPVIADYKKAYLVLKWLEKEVDRRLDTFQAKGVQDIEVYYQKCILNKKGTVEYMPYIFMIIDEFSDIVNEYPKEIEGVVSKVIQKSHLVGITVILSTSQVTDKNVVKIIKSGNIRSRIAFKTTNSNESKIVLNTSGSEKLEAPGEILFQSKMMKFPVCIKLSQIQEKEIKNNLNEIKAKGDTIDYNFTEKNDDMDEDELYEEAKMVVIEAGKASTSYIQRKLGVGYARAAQLIDILEEKGVIGPGSGAMPREVLLKEEK